MRLHTLDYLRGLAASGIMIYHLTNWTYSEHDAGTFIGRVGIYGVSIFYVLSGLTLYHVYFGKFKSRDFFTKRIFRIFPMMWLATIATIWLQRPELSVSTLLLNFSGLFGFIRPADGIATGIWSIGNELVFYALFPLMVWLAKKKKFHFLLFFSFLVYVFFAFNYHEGNLKDQWNVYVNPFNQLFLFAAGFAIGFYKIAVKGWIALSVIIISLMAFIYFPVKGDLINIVSETPRLIFSALVIFICTGFYYLPYRVPVLHWFLKRLGEASYSVYLLHPIVLIVLLRVLARLSLSLPNEVVLSITILITIVGSYIMYQTVEKFFIELARDKKRVPAI